MMFILGLGGMRTTGTGSSGLMLPSHGAEWKKGTDVGHGGTGAGSHGFTGMLNHGHGAEQIQTGLYHGVMKLGVSGTRTLHLGSIGKIESGLGGMRRQRGG